ncbi:unnamed protein product, partial [Porites evermanni]
LRECADVPKGNGELPGLSLILFHSNDTKTIQNSDNQGKLFRAVKNLLVETKSLCFSDYTDKSALANDIGKYFVQKISRLREERDQGYVPNDQSYVLDDSDVNSDSTIPPTRIEAFELLAEDDVRSCLGPLLFVVYASKPL